MFALFLLNYLISKSLLIHSNSQSILVQTSNDSNCHSQLYNKYSLSRNETCQSRILTISYSSFALAKCSQILVFFFFFLTMLLSLRFDLKTFYVSSFYWRYLESSQNVLSQRFVPNTLCSFEIEQIFSKCSKRDLHDRVTNASRREILRDWVVLIFVYIKSKQSNIIIHRDIDLFLDFRTWSQQQKRFFFWFCVVIISITHQS